MKLSMACVAAGALVLGSGCATPTTESGEAVVQDLASSLVVPPAIDGIDVPLSLSCRYAYRMVGGDVFGSSEPRGIDLVVRLSTKPALPLDYIGQPDSQQTHFTRISAPFFQVRTGWSSLPVRAPELLSLTLTNKTPTNTATTMTWAYDEYPIHNCEHTAKLEILPDHRLKLTYSFEDFAGIRPPAPPPQPGAPTWTRLELCEGISAPTPLP